MKEVNIYKIKKKTIEKKEFDVKINSINSENQLKMDIDKKISEIINFKSNPMFLSKFCVHNLLLKHFIYH